MARKNPETDEIKQKSSTLIDTAIGLNAAGVAANAARLSKQNSGIFERNTPARPSTGLGYPSAPAHTPNPTLGRVIGAPNAWNYTANLSGWQPSSVLGKVGKFGVGTGTALLTSAATDAAVDWVTKTGNNERVNALTKKLKSQGIDITKEEVSTILMQYADPMAASKVMGLDYNTYAGGVKMGSQIIGAAGGGAATSAGLGSYFQGLRNWIESGAYDERDNMVESIIKQRRGAESRMKKRVAELGPAMAQGLYGPQYRKEMEMPTLGQVGFNAPKSDTESMSPEELNARNNYLSTPVQERIWRKDAPLVGGEQFYKDVAEMFPSEQQVIDESNPDAPRILGPATQVPEGLRRQQIDEIMNFHNLAPEVKARIEGGKTADMIYSGQPTFNANNGKGGQPVPEQKLPSGGGMREVTSTYTLPTPRLAPPSSPEEATNNIITGGVARGLSPQAAIMENYINKSGRKTAEQRDAEIAAALQDPNSAFSQAARRNYAGAQANNPYAQVTKDQLKGRDQGTANALKLLSRGIITADQMPRDYVDPMNPKQSKPFGESYDVDAEGNVRSTGYQRYMDWADKNGFFDSRQARLAKAMDDSFQQTYDSLNADNATRINAFNHDQDVIRRERAANAIRQRQIDASSALNFPSGENQITNPSNPSASGGYVNPNTYEWVDDMNVVQREPTQPFEPYSPQPNFAVPTRHRDGTVSPLGEWIPSTTKTKAPLSGTRVTGRTPKLSQKPNDILPTGILNYNIDRQIEMGRRMLK